MLKKLLFAFLAVAALLGATGCNTTHGAGKDLENAGQAIQGTSDDLHP